MSHLTLTDTGRQVRIEMRDAMSHSVFSAYASLEFYAFVLVLFGGKENKLRCPQVPLLTPLDNMYIPPI